jgi:hypothetical protein
MTFDSAFVRRFWAKVDRNGPISERRPDLGQCWLWNSSRVDRGYGRIRLDGRQTPAHRVAYEILRGPIPAGLETDHLCQVHWCVNPDHLEMVTHEENMRRADSSHKAFCIHGHALTPDNLYVYRGKRSCRICIRERLARSDARRRSQS